MVNFRAKARHFLNALIERCLNLGFVQACLRVYYWSALKGLAALLRVKKYPQVQKVYLRHGDWILGVSDIDLVIVFKAIEPQSDVRFLVKFTRSYSALRVLFPMLCEFEEIRFMETGQLAKHPLKEKEEAKLLMAPQKWAELYSVENTPDFSFLIKDECPASAPHTRFLYFNLYNYLQWALLSGAHISRLRFLRLRKCILKILQHIFYLEHKKCFDLEEMVRLIGQSQDGGSAAEGAKSILAQLQDPRHDHSRRRERFRKSFYEVLFLLDDMHMKHYRLADGAWPVVHDDGSQWIGDDLAEFVTEGNRTFGKMFRVVAMRPVFEVGQTVYVLIDRDVSPETFERLIDFSALYYHRFREQEVHLRVSTAQILSSQYYASWTPYALEAQILSSRGSFDPAGLFKIKRPPDEWTEWKIRNSLSIAREYYLPLLAAAHVNSDKKKPCKMYERIDVSMLFHYFYFLKDRASYLRDLQEARGDSKEILSRAASKYANEIGIQDWLVRRHLDAYPYIKRMVDQVDEMAVERMRNSEAPA